MCKMRTKLTKPLAIIGSGGFALEVFNYAKDLKYPVACFVDKETKESIFNIPVLKEEEIDWSEYFVTIAVGNPVIRQKIVEQLPKNVDHLSIIHPSAYIGKEVKVGKGAIICPKVILTTKIVLGDFAHLNLLSTIGHECSVGHYLTTAPGAKISGNCQIGHNVYFGTNSCVIEKKNIISGAIIGAGAVVVKDIVEVGTYVGIPAKKL